MVIPPLYPASSKSCWHAWWPSWVLRGVQLAKAQEQRLWCPPSGPPCLLPHAALPAEDLLLAPSLFVTGTFHPRDLKRKQLLLVDIWGLSVLGALWMSPDYFSRYSQGQSSLYALHLEASDMIPIISEACCTFTTWRRELVWSRKWRHGIMVTYQKKYGTKNTWEKILDMKDILKEENWSHPSAVPWSHSYIHSVQLILSIYTRALWFSISSLLGRYTSSVITSMLENVHLNSASTFQTINRFLINWLNSLCLPLGSFTFMPRPQIITWQREGTKVSKY